VLGRPTDNSTAGAATRTATGCLTRGAGTEPQDVLVRLIDARYRGRPALIGVYLTGPSPGGAPDKVLVWVVRRDGCEFASYTQDRI